MKDAGNAVRDLLIIGSGPAGIRAAMCASRGGLNVTVFEGGSLGGTALNTGCLPTKSLLHSAWLHNQSVGSRYGHTLNSQGYDMGAAIARKNSSVRKLSLELQQQLEDCPVELVMQKAAIAGMDGANIAVTAGDKKYLGARLLLATGSDYAPLTIDGLEESMREGLCVTASQICKSYKAPRSVCIIGGGRSAVEIAQIYMESGAAVTLLNFGAPRFSMPDAEYAEYYENLMTKKGLVIVNNAVIESVDKGCVLYSADGQSGALHTERVILATKRVPVTDGLGTEKLDGLVCGAGGIEVDSHMRTGVKGVWAAGDCTGAVDLVHVALRQAEVAVDDMLGYDTVMSYESVPVPLFTMPEAGYVGLSLEQARALGMDAWEAESPLHKSNRHAIECINEPGMAKFVLNGDVIVGFHMVGLRATELVASAAIMIAGKTPVDELRNSMLPCMTMNELLNDMLNDAVFRHRKRVKRG